MKKIVLMTALCLSSLVAIISCTTDKTGPTIALAQNLTVSSPAAAASYTLTAPNANQVALTVKWTSANFGSSTVVGYTLQLIKNGGNFDSNSTSTFDLGKFNESGNVITHEKTITQRQLNVMVLNVMGNIGALEGYKVRVIGSPDTQTGSNATILKSTSPEIAITCSPFDTYDEFSKLYLPGNYGGASGFADWSGAGNSATIYSPLNDGKYEGFVWLNIATPEFKVNPDPTWSGNDKGENSATGAFSGVLGTNQNIKPADGAGTYYLTINWPALTYTMQKRQVAIIGAATPNGWGTPTYLDFDTNPNSPTYKSYTKNLTLAADQFLIRLKDDFSEKMGTVSGNQETINATIQNKIKLGGGNMVVPTAGNYKVVLSISNSANYNLKLIPN